MKTSKWYPPTVRERAVRLALASCDGAPMDPLEDEPQAVWRGLGAVSVHNG